MDNLKNPGHLQRGRKKNKKFRQPERDHFSKKHAYSKVLIFFSQISDNLEILEECRKSIKDIPKIKTDLFTVAIAGFPNVGKSTLLGKITDSKPEVDYYAFTTKSLMIGYIKSNDVKIQAIDTPGTLDRFNRMNNIEKIAHICLREVADLIVYIFDLTEPYPIKDQVKLYESMKDLKKPIIVYFSKADILGGKKIEGFDIKGFYNAEALREKIISSMVSK